MNFHPESALNRQIKLHRYLSAASFTFFLTAIISGGFCILFLAAARYVFLAVSVPVCVFSATGLIIISVIYKKESAGGSHCPYEIIPDSKPDYARIRQTLSRTAGEGKSIDFENDEAFFCLSDGKFRNRITVMHMHEFTKAEFDAVRKKINRRVNREFDLPSRAPLAETYRMMRTNIIVADGMNGELYEFISCNAAGLLTRAEGIISFAVVSGKLIVPPFYGSTDITEISRYKESVGLIKGYLG